MNRTPILTFCLMLLSVSLFSFPIEKPVEMLGLKLDDLFVHRNKPLEVFPYRGVEADEDTVVFYYQGGLYLFLHSNRVWQVRFDRTAETLPLELKIGSERSVVLSRFMEENLIPLSIGDDFVTYQISEIPWPVRVKLFFVNEKLDDVYIYRGDF